MQIPRSYIENYSNSLNQISDTARESLSKALMQLNYDADIADIRNAVIAVMQTACGASTDLSARLAADFYDGLRLQFGIDDGYQAEVDSGRIPEATDGAVRAFVQDLVDDKPIEQFVGKCVDRLDYETRKAANECIATNAKNDPKKPRWARVPTGAETCQFCIMLASRGFVYHSEETASHAHAHCDCRVIPSWDKSPTAQGYDPDLYYDMWRHPEKFSGGSNSGGGLRDEKERRKLYDEYREAIDKRAELSRQMRAEKDSAKKDALKKKILEADELIDIARNKMTNGELLIETARIYPAGDYVRPERWESKPSQETIIQTLGGGDKTVGSCSSLAFAYFANKGGYLVRDFRGGSSCRFFSTVGHIKEVCKIDGVDSFTESNLNAFKATNAVLTNVQEGKQYYLSIAKHSAVVEKRGDSIYYMELQSVADNGWHELTNAALKTRFGCTKSSSIAGIKVEQDAILIDGDTLQDNAEFIELMGFVNTPESEQQKGAGGRAK